MRIHPDDIDEFALWIGRLSPSTTDQDLHQLFSQYGPCTAFIILDRITRVSRRFGFVHYSTPEDAANALASLDGYVLDGTSIRVRAARRRAEAVEP